MKSKELPKRFPKLTRALALGVNPKSPSEKDRQPNTKRARGEICTPNLLTLDQVPLLVGLRERKLVAATGLAPVRSGLKDRSLDLLCIRGQRFAIRHFFIRLGEQCVF